MSSICLGITDKNLPCKQRCIRTTYCRFHKNQNVKPLITPFIIEEKDENDSGLDECSICLCGVSVENDCNLICNHAHHSECIKQILKAECPVCRGPLIFKNNNINVKIIKEREEKEMKQNIENTIQEDILLVRELSQNTNNVNNNTNREEELINRVIADSLVSFENDDYEYMAKILTYSYDYAEQEEEKLIKEAIECNLLIEKQQRENESISDTINRLMQGKSHVTIKLK
jgi:hypothetical protein